MEKDLTVLLLLLYYNRPRLVRNMLQSIKESTYKNWKVALIDDGSDFPAEPIVREMFTDEELAKVTFYNIPDTKADKQARGGSIIGEKMNEAMDTLGCDLTIFACDDDAIHAEYLGNLNKFFKEHPEVHYGYSHIIPFNPYEQDWKTVQPTESWLNKTHTLDPFCQVDASQVCWRTYCCAPGKARFPVPKTANLDADIYGRLCEEFGLCPYMGFYGQYKAQFPNQLGNHSSYDRVD